MTAELRIGVIGIGNMGRFHAQALLGGKVRGGRLTALCSRRPEKISGLENFAGKIFADYNDLIRSELVDAVIITTPHFSHTDIGIAALNAGLHVLTDKPISAHKQDALRLLAAHTNPQLAFGAIFQFRANPLCKKVRELVRGGEIGAIRRISWVITDWFRTDAYYQSNAWRATWAGEGGGVLLSQCPHNLDLWQWTFGMPRQLRAFCHYGKTHDIETEDEVTAYFEYDDGATGVFVTSTGESPGVNRLEIAGDRGLIVVEKGKALLTRNKLPAGEFIRTSPEVFGRIENETAEVQAEGADAGHLGMLQNFVDAALTGAALIAPAAEGLHSLELANAMQYSSDRGIFVELPLNADNFAEWLKSKIAHSTHQKKIVERTADVSGSFK